MTRIRSRRLRYYCLPLLAGTLLSAGSSADEQLDFRDMRGKAVTLYTQDIENRPFESIKYAKRVKVKGWRFSEGVDFGGFKAVDSTP